MLPDYAEQRLRRKWDAVTDNPGLEQVEELPKFEFFDPRPSLSQDSESKELRIVTLKDVAPLLIKDDPKVEAKNVATEVVSSTDTEVEAIEKDFFTIGSTEDEVIAVMGTPTAVQFAPYFKTLFYGSATVTIKSGRVTEYSNGAGLKVRPLSSDSSQGFFTIGSTEEEVIAVMGTPTSVHDYSSFKTLYFGSSTVTIKRGRVSEYSNSGGLKVRLQSTASSLGYFTIGSTEDEVIAVMGTPTSVHDYSSFKTLYFGSSTVTIKRGRVSEYSNSGGLKVRLQSTTSLLGYFKIGSTEDEVIAVMGTPTSIHDYSSFKTLYFGSATVTIKSGRVSEYSNSGGRLKVKAS